MSFDQYSHQQDTICKATEGLDFAKAIWKSLAWGPLAHHCGHQPYKKRHAIKKHMNTVAEKTKRIERLDNHKRKV
ncbi:unnamed protein product [Clonostachys rhizophaga]|uniref:Uncharacterized protein n=1 Tax=Clonostachys rhizophaga TaxID=160324 RepID=A0A9N9VUQ3_9HYPO|nr:unnamed protein product [Clonostachys rhizophaga]